MDLSLALKRAAGIAIETFPELDTFFNIYNGMPLEAVTLVSDALLTTCQFNEKLGQIVATRSGAFGIDQIDVAKNLIIRAIIYGYRNVYDSFLQIIAGGPITTSTVYITKGITVTEKIAITESVFLAPLISLTECPARTDAIKIWIELNDQIADPTALVVKSISKPHWGLKPTINGTPLIPFDLVAPFNTKQIVDAISISSGVNFTTDYSYTIVEDPGWIGPLAMGTGGSRRVTPVLPLNKTYEFQIQETASFLSRSIHTKDIQTAIDKLRDAGNRWDLSEKALDLGACLEIILMRGETNGGEIALKIRLRAAWLMGTTPDERRSISALVKKVYAMRSTVAHTGTLRSNRNFNNFEENEVVLRSAEALCRRMITHILKQGWPDWEQLVLGT